MNESINAAVSQSIGLGQIQKGTVQEVITSQKNGIISKRTMLRLKPEQLKPIAGSIVLKVSKDGRDNSVFAAELTLDQIKAKIAESSGNDQVADYFIDLVNESRRQYFSSIIASDPGATFCDASLANVIPWATAETKRGRQASGFSGEEWKIGSAILLSYVARVAKEKLGKELTSQLAGLLMAQLKTVCTVGQAMPSDKLKATMVSMLEMMAEDMGMDSFNSRPDKDIVAAVVGLFGRVVELKEQLELLMGDGSEMF